MLLAPHLDRDLLHRQRDRGLGLGRLDRDAVGAELRREPVRDDGAEPFQGLVGALLGDQRDHLADLAVVDGVLDAVGDQRVGLADVEAHVEHEALADLALGGRDAVVGEQREADDLDRDADLGTFAFGVVGLLAQVVLVVVVELGVVPGHLAANVAAVTARASAVAATSCTRKTLAPRSKASTLVATVPATRSVTSRPVRRPRNDLRDVPTTNGRPSAASSSNRRSSSRLCSSVLPKPIPGSSWMRSSRTPSPTANAIRSSRKALTSDTTSS